MAKSVSLEDLLTKDTKQLLDELRRTRFTPTPPLPSPARPAPRVMDRPDLPDPPSTPLPHREDFAPDDPNLEDWGAPRPERAADAPLPAEHDGLERDYIYTLAGGRAADAPQLGGGIPNQQDDSFDPDDVPPPPATPEVKVGGGRVWAEADPAIFHGIAFEVYHGQVVLDRQGRAWEVFTYSVSGNTVVLQDPTHGFKAKTALNKFLGRELGSCPFELGDVVAIPDPASGGEREVTVLDLSESAQCLWTEVDGRRRQVRFSKARLVRRAAQVEGEE